MFFHYLRCFFLAMPVFCLNFHNLFNICSKSVRSDWPLRYLCPLSLLITLSKLFRHNHSALPVILLCFLYYLHCKTSWSCGVISSLWTLGEPTGMFFSWDWISVKGSKQWWMSCSLFYIDPQGLWVWHISFNMGIKRRRQIIWICSVGDYIWAVKYLDG